VRLAGWLCRALAGDRAHRSACAQANSSVASSEGYTLEGTKKTGASKKKLAAVMAKVKAEALKK